MEMKLSCVVCEHEWSSNQTNLRDTSQQVEWKCFIQPAWKWNWLCHKHSTYCVDRLWPWMKHVTMNEAPTKKYSETPFNKMNDNDNLLHPPPPISSNTCWLCIILTLSSESSSCAPSFSSSIWALSRAISSLQWALKSCSCFFRFSFIATRERRFCRTLC